LHTSTDTASGGHCIVLVCTPAAPR